MTTKTLAVLSSFLCLAAVSVSAQTFEQQVADASGSITRQARASRAAAAKAAQAAKFSVQGAPAEYAKTIVCDMPKASGFTAGLKFYTRLDAKASAAVPADESAAALDDYRSSYIKDGQFHYDAWSCDTQDYWFSFDAESLLKTSPNEKSGPVKGHLRQETRGQLDWEGDLSCTAFF